MGMELHERVSIILPVLSITLVFVFLARPGITGFAVGQGVAGNSVNAEIRVTTAEGVFLPAGSLIEVGIGEEVSSMPLARFIEISGAPYELAVGGTPEISYSGPGYTGNHTYAVQLSEFKMDRPLGEGLHAIKVRVVYNGTVISQGEKDVLV